MRRRTFLAGSAASLVAASGTALALDEVPIIDAHMHLFDATRPQGAPYTGSPQFKGGQSLPEPYIAQARAARISGAMAMEASAWIEDNLWLMERVESSPFFVGMVGMLEPDKPDFPATLERFAKNKLFRGIRYGKLWGLNISSKVDDAAFISGLRRMAEMGLVLDTANIDVDLLQTAVRLNDKVPELKIVLDHTPAFAPRPADRDVFEAVMREIGGRPTISTKLSWNFITAAMVDHVEDGKPVAGLPAYRDRLDMLTGTFGEDRVVFCSNYPQTVGRVVTTVPQISALAKAYYASRPRLEAEKFFWKNALTIYGWVKRDPSQPEL